MVRGVNKVLLLGHVGAKPDVRQMPLPRGGMVANIRIATTDVWRDKQTGERQERTEWHRIVFFNKLAEIVEKRVTVGALVYIEGSLRTRKWRDSSNIERYTTEIVATDMQIAHSRNNNNHGNGGAGGYSNNQFSSYQTQNHDTGQFNSPSAPFNAPQNGKMDQMANNTELSPLPQQNTAPAPAAASTVGVANTAQVDDDDDIPF